MGVIKISYSKIKSSALILFSQKGFEGTTIKDIASASGLKPSSVYSHITTKEALFTSIWTQCLQNVSHSVADLQSKVESKELSDPEKILHLYYVRIIKHFILHNHDYLFLKQATFFTRNKNILDQVNVEAFFNDDIIFKYFSPFFSELQQKSLIAETDPLALAHSYIGLIITYMEQRLIYNTKFCTNYSDMLWHIFWKGISK